MIYTEASLDSHWTYLQPLVEGLSCSELSRLKALELLGGDGLWEFELQERQRQLTILGK